MTYHNILSNPTLQTSEDALHVEKIHVLDFPPQYIWHPIQWKTTVTPTVRGQYTKRTDDLHIIPTVWPQTVNNKQVLTIEANTKHFVVKLEQFQVPLKAHQRYLVKLLFTPAVQPTGNATPTDLAWRILLSQRGNDLGFTDGFQSAASVSEWGQPRSALLVVHSYAEQTVDLAVEFWSKFGNLDKQIYIHSVEVLEVEADYGEDGNVHVIGTPTTEPPGPTPDPPPDPEPEPDTPTAPAWMLPVFIGVLGVIIGTLIYSIVAPHIQYVVMEVNPVEELLNQLFAIPAIAPIAFTSGIVYFLVEIIKRLKARFVPEGQGEWLTPELSAVVLIGFFMLMYAIAQQFQVEGAVKDFAKLITELVGVLGPYVLGMIGTQVVTTVGYNAARKHDVVGFKFDK